MAKVFKQDEYGKTLKYFGQFDFDMMTMHGWGTYHFEDGSIYDGQFEHNKKSTVRNHTQAKTDFWGNSESSFQTPTDTIYVGEWKNDEPHGIGILTIGDYKYTGNFIKGLQSGYGDLITSRKVYEGDFKEGKRHGQGECVWTDIGVYNGSWKNDKQHGHGKFTWDAGDTYLGDWEDYDFNGRGRYTYSDGRYEEGDYSKGIFQGEGGLWGQDGILVNYGIWKDNKYIEGLPATKKKDPADCSQKIFSQSTFYNTGTQSTVITRLGPQCDYL